MADHLEEQLVKNLTDAYSIEQQALAQLRTAPDLVEDPTLAGHLREHLTETEEQAERVRARLEAHGGSPQKAKDLVMKLGGKGMVAFAGAQPDTTGKLTAHAHSYEALEWASYEMLIRMAERAGDAETAATARAIRDQERAMMERLAGDFDGAVAASLREVPSDDLAQHLRHYLADAHALEAQAVELLKKGEKLAGDPQLAEIYRQHLAESREQAKRVEQRLIELGGSPSKLKDAALAIAGWQWGLFFGAQGETPGKLAVFTYAFENLEIAGYELLKRTAQRAGDARTVDLAEQILVEERVMADRLAGTFDRAFEASMAAEGIGVR
jgi:ferritin-like metal-binding protein YciE